MGIREKDEARFSPLVHGLKQNGKHFLLDIRDSGFGFAIDEDKVAAEAALDGIYVIRTSAATERMSADEAVRGYISLSQVERRHAYQVRASSALSSMKNNLVRLLIADPVDRQRLLLALVRQLSSTVEAVRSDRTFPRYNPSQLKPGFHASYKRLA